MTDLFAWGDAGWGDEILFGALTTIRLALVSLPVGLAIGLTVAALSMARGRVARAIATGYTTLMRGLPEILTLFIVYNGVGMLINGISGWIAPDARPPELSPFIAGVAALAMVFGAFSAEVIRGAFMALDKGQAEAARAFGMRPVQILFLVQLPQVWRLALPGLGNLWINMLKDTALVSVIALDELMRATKVAIGVTKQPFTFYLIACLIYWGLSVASEVGLARMERRANRYVGKR